MTLQSFIQTGTFEMCDPNDPSTTARDRLYIANTGEKTVTHLTRFFEKSLPHWNGAEFFWSLKSSAKINYGHGFEIEGYKLIYLWDNKRIKGYTFEICLWPGRYTHGKWLKLTIRLGFMAQNLKNSMKLSIFCVF